MSSLKEIQYAEQFLRDNLWRSIRGYKLDHNKIEGSWDYSYWDDLSDILSKCEYWIHNEYPERCFEDPWEAIDFVEEQEGLDFIKWRKENHEVILNEDLNVH